MQLESCFYECKISHSRLCPKKHEFAHKHFMAYLDLDEISELNSRIFKKVFYSFNERIYLPDEELLGCLKQRVITAFQNRGIEGVEKVFLLTNLSFLGYVFNPISVYYCFDSDKRPLACLAEVGNTFGEKKLYFVSLSSSCIARERLRKLFYISPFTELDQELDFLLPFPDETISVQVDTLQREEHVIKAKMNGKRVAMSVHSLWNLTLSFPFAPLRVILLIHLHALFLWLKRVPYRSKELSPELQTKVLHPHRSLRSSAEKARLRERNAR